MRPIETAPRDGRNVILFHGARNVSERAYWNPLVQGWVRDGDPALRALHNVRFWEADA